MRTLLLAVLLPATCNAQLWPGGRPTPRWSWDTLPVAYHGAPRSREFTDSELHALAKFSMVSWPAACARCSAPGGRCAECLLRIAGDHRKVVHQLCVEGPCPERTGVRTSLTTSRSWQAFSSQWKSTPTLHASAQVCPRGVSTLTGLLAMFSAASLLPWLCGAYRCTVVPVRRPGVRQTSWGSRVSGCGIPTGQWAVAAYLRQRKRPHHRQVRHQYEPGHDCLGG